MARAVGTAIARPAERAARAIVVGDASILDIAGGVHGALGEDASERQEVVLERRARQRLQRHALDVGLIHDGLLLLERKHRGPHRRIVAAALVLRRIEQPLADEPLLRLGERRPLGEKAQPLLHILRGPRVRGRQRLQRRGARGGARRLQARAARRLLAELFRLRARPPGPHLVDRQQLLRIERRRAVAPRVLEKAPAQHRERRRDAVELQVIPLARSERLTVTVRPIGRQAG